MHSSELISIGDDGEKRMSMGECHAGQTMVGLSGTITDTVVLNEAGEGLFKVKAAPYRFGH